MTNEPIAWMVYTLDGTSVCVTDNPTDFTPEHRALPLYTTPPAQRNTRNATLDEIATKIEKMPFGDTAASFAVWIREQKTKTCPPCHGDCNQGRTCPARGSHA